MGLRVSGKNLDIGESLRTYVGLRLDSVTAKYSTEPKSGHVTVEREGSGFRTDCILRFDDGIILQVEAAAQDAYASFNKAADRIEKRLRRLKRRLHDRGSSQAHRFVGGDAAAELKGAANRAVNGTMNGAADPESANSEFSAERNPLVIAEPFASLKEMSVSGAVKALDDSDAPVLVFRHAGDGRTHIVYRRPDGNIGWIETAGAERASL